MTDVLIAPDKFKGCLTAAEVADALADGVRGGGGTADLLPLADGGDGSVDAALGAGFEPVTVRVPDAAGSLHDAQYASDGSTAVVEVANTCGLALLGGRLDPLGASSRGLGVAVRHALDAGHRRVVLALGGSASTDAGAGFLAGLDCDPSRPETLDVELVVAADVDNPLLGRRGAAPVFGPQKGADADAVHELEARLAQAVRDCWHPEAERLAEVAGAGAAGGIGWAAMLLGGTVVGGAHFFLDLLGFDERVAQADLVITGEGRFDAQSLGGKLPVAVAERSGGRPVHVVAGSVADDVDARAALDTGFSGTHDLSALVGDTRRDPDAAADGLRQLAERVLIESVRG